MWRWCAFFHVLSWHSSCYFFFSFCKVLFNGIVNTLPAYFLLVSLVMARYIYILLLTTTTTKFKNVFDWKCVLCLIINSCKILFVLSFFTVHRSAPSSFIVLFYVKIVLSCIRTLYRKNTDMKGISAILWCMWWCWCINKQSV